MSLLDLSRLRRLLRPVNEASIRWRCRNAYLGDNTSLCRILGRYKCFVDTRDVGLSSHLLLEGYWELWVTEALVPLVRPGMVVADIGANLGYFTLLMSDLVGAEGRVHAFEPNPEMYKRLCKSVDVNGFTSRCQVHQTLLGSTNGEKMVFVVPPNEPKNGHMFPYSDFVPEGAVVLETTRLDSEPAWRDIELAKIDVEGAEQLIWEGATGLLQSTRLKTIVLEFTPERYPDAREFLGQITAHGFAITIISKSRGLVAASPDDVLAGSPNIDVMLLLQR